MPDSTQVYEEIAKREGTVVRVSLDVFKNHTFISVREWWKPDDEENYRPTQKGVTIPVDDSGALTAIIKGLQRARTDLFGEEE